MSLDQMKGVADCGAYVEITDDESIEWRTEVIRAVGVEHCFLSSDGGSAEAATPVERLRSSAGLLVEAGFTVDEVRYMTTAVPSYLLKLAGWADHRPNLGDA
jgi:hypothetical protein